MHMDLPAPLLLAPEFTALSSLSPVFLLSLDLCICFSLVNRVSSIYSWPLTITGVRGAALPAVKSWWVLTYSPLVPLYPWVVPTSGGFRLFTLEANPRATGSAHVSESQQCRG